ncbi:MAG: zf-HC2 domain-containing protein [Armatimonadetes bacterium]|nr:zf-HC2 domain-containing protein [Armatimonadota bacterium]
MKCETAREHFSELVEGSIDQTLKFAIESHLGACPGCTQEFESFGQTWSVLEALPSFEPPPYLRHRVMDAVFTQPEQTRASRSIWDRLREGFFAPSTMGRRLAWSGAALAAALVVGAGALTMHIPGGTVATGVVPIPGQVSRVGLAAVDVTPQWQGNDWALAISGPSELIGVRVFPAEEGWNPASLASSSPVSELRLATGMDFRNSTVLKPHLSPVESGVSVAVLQFHSGGMSRHIAVFLPERPRSIAQAVAQGVSVRPLEEALLQISRDYQVAIVADTGFSATVTVRGGASAEKTLESIAQQARMEYQSLGGGAFRLTKI